MTRPNEKEVLLTIPCDVVLSWGATPKQLAALGSALWGWSLRTAGETALYRQLDNQPLADLIAGRFPARDLAASITQAGGLSFRIRDEASHDRQGTIDQLRREVPSQGIKDIVVAGKSWISTDAARPPAGDVSAGAAVIPEGRHDEP